MTEITWERMRQVADECGVEVIENSANPGFYIERSDKSCQKLSVEDLVKIVLGEPLD